MANTDWKAPQTHRLPLDEPAVQARYLKAAETEPAQEQPVEETPVEKETMEEK